MLTHHVPAFAGFVFLKETQKIKSLDCNDVATPPASEITFLTQESEEVCFNSPAHSPARTSDLLLLSPLNYVNVALRCLVVSVLATGPKVRGFKPGRGRWI
jgi:hypothetical protein